MIPALGCDHRLLNLAQELLAIRQAQAKIREVVKVAGAVNLQHVNATQRPLDPGLHQTHPIPDPQSLKLPGRHTPSTRHPQLLDGPPTTPKPE